MVCTGIDLDTYRRSIGSFVSVRLHTVRLERVRCGMPARRFASLVHLFVFSFLLLRARSLPLHGDVELNPGPIRLSTSRDGSVQDASGVRFRLGDRSNLNLNVNRHHLRDASPGRQAASPRQVHVANETFSVLFGNARSVFPKLEELRHRVQQSQPDVVAITESWLRNTDSDASLSLAGYDVHRRDRQALRPNSSAVRRGGGVAVWVCSHVKCSRRTDLELWSEDLWLEFPSSRARGRTLLLGCVYRPPDKSVEDYCTTLESVFAQVDHTSTEVILLGDFNATSPAWQSSDSYNSAGLVLEPATLQLGLKQFVDFPTRLSNALDAACGSCIDLVFCTAPALVNHLSAVAPLGTSDHVMVNCVFHRQSVVSELGSRLRRIWNYDKADFDKLNNALSSADWSAVYTAPDIDVAWAEWKHIFFAHVSKAVPSKYIRHVKPQPPWMTGKIRSTIKDKHKAWRAFKTNPCAATKSAFVFIRNRVTSLLRSAERSYLTTLHRDIRLTNSTNSVKLFWRRIKSLSGRIKSSVIPDLQVKSDQGQTVRLASKNADKANVLNSFFTAQTRLVNCPSSVPALPRQVPTDSFF